MCGEGLCDVRPALFKALCVPARGVSERVHTSRCLTLRQRNGLQARFSLCAKADSHLLMLGNLGELGRAPTVTLCLRVALIAAIAAIAHTVVHQRREDAFVTRLALEMGAA
jgi:hypothetical protein